MRRTPAVGDAVIAIGDFVLPDGTPLRKGAKGTVSSTLHVSHGMIEVKWANGKRAVHSFDSAFKTIVVRPSARRKIVRKSR